MNFLTLMRSLIVFLICLLLPLIPLTAAEFQKGFEAHLRGDYAAAIREWGPLAAQGDPRAQFNIGNMFDFGKGVKEDNAQAVYWYKKSAEKGNASAQYALGWMYDCLLYTSPSPRDLSTSRMPSSA